jgi:type VI secretion system secreted protein Hcp
MPIYMNFDGIKGSVTAEGHKDWIELQSCQLGVNRHVTNATGRGVNREASAPAVGEIVVTKSEDCASTGLFRASLWENTLVSSYSVSGHGGDNHSRPMESLSLNFTKITYNTIAMDSKNATAKPDRASWDLAQSKGS